MLCESRGLGLKNTLEAHKNHCSEGQQRLWSPGYLLPPLHSLCWAPLPLSVSGALGLERLQASRGTNMFSKVNVGCLFNYFKREMVVRLKDTESYI